MERCKMPELDNPVAIELETAKKIQRVKYWYTYTITDTIPNGGTRPLFLTVEQDADFHMYEVTTSAHGPVNEDGTPISPDTDKVTDFPFPGLPATGATAAAARGLTVRITDTGAGRELTSGEIPVELIGTPGYGQQLYIPFKLKYLALRNTKLRFDVRNRDLAVGASAQDEFHEVSFGLHGYKFESYLGV